MKNIFIFMVLTIFSIGFANAEGGSRPITNAQSQAQSAAGAGAESNAVGGSVVIDQSVSGSNNQDYPKQPVWGAASLMLNGCQEGVSGQGNSAGVSSAFESATCTQLRLAETYQKLAIYYTEKGDVNQAEMYNRLLGEAVAKAGEAGDFQHYPKTVGGAASAIIPLGLLGWLITLI